MSNDVMGIDAAAEKNASHHALKKGTIGWISLAAMGVSFVIAGEFAAWNYGLGVSGWGAMICALCIVATMYFCIGFSLAELSAIMPTAGGGSRFAERAFGPFWGYLTGLTIVFEYTLASSVIALFFQAYFSSLFGGSAGVVVIILYSVFLLINLAGVSESVKLLMVLAGVTLLGLLLFLVSMVPFFDARNLSAMPDSAVPGVLALAPDSFLDIWMALPFAVMMFLAVEGVPLCAEETKSPEKNVPKGLLASILVLFLLSGSILLLATGGAGIEALSRGDTPLVTALNSVGITTGTVLSFVNIAGLVGITASFFSSIYAFSRQIYAMSRAGHLPYSLSLTNRWGAPWVAILVPGFISYLLTLTEAADQIVFILAFCATVSYVLMMAAHIRLRYREKSLHRPYRTPGGVFTSALALVLSVLAFLSALAGNIVWAGYTCLLLLAGCLYYWFSKRELLG